MARDWVKLHTAMLFHEDIQGLEGETFKLWVNLILFAGLIDDGGKLGQPANVAFALRVKPGQLEAALSDLGGRIVRDPDGSVRIRDWGDWQAASDRDRKRSQRSRESAPARDEPPVSAVSPDVTTCHDMSREDTDGHGSHLYEIRQDQQEQQEQPEVTTTAPPAESAAGASNGHAGEEVGWKVRWEPFIEDCGVLWSTSPWQKKGDPYAWVGRLVGLFGKFVLPDGGKATDREVGEARRLLARWARSEEFKFALNPQLAPDKAGKWLTENALYDDVVQR